MNTDMIHAPFTAEQAEALNRWQCAGTVHEFTCPNDHGEQTRVLVAHVGAGWCCPTCGYTQMWAHRMMLHVPPPPFGRHGPSG